MIQTLDGIEKVKIGDPIFLVGDEVQTKEELNCKENYGKLVTELGVKLSDTTMQVSNFKFILTEKETE